MDYRTFDGAGPFTVADALAAGFTWNSIRWAIRSKHWVRLRAGVLVTQDDRSLAALDAATLHAQDVKALMLALSARRLVAAGTSAAQIFGLALLSPPPPEIVVLTADAGASSTHRDGYFLRFAQLPSAHVTHRHGVPLTTAARTLVDIAANLPFDDGVVAAESAFHLKRVTRSEVDLLLAQSSGRPGIQAARQSLGFATPGPESALESVSRISMHKAGIPAPQLQADLIPAPPRIRVDFYWPQYRLVGEADGMSKYTADPQLRSALAVVRDERHREQRLRDAGFDIVRWDWTVANDPARLAARLRAAFARATERLDGRSG